MRPAARERAQQRAVIQQSSLFDDAALTLTDSRRSWLDPVVLTPAATWRRQALDLIREIPAGQTFSATTLHSRITQPDDSRVVAATFMRAKALGLIELAGLTRPYRGSDHGSVISLWRRTDVR